MADTLHNARFHFESAGLAGVAMDVVSAQVVEALSEPYGAELVIGIEDPDADASLLLGADCVLTVERPEGEVRRLCGIIRAVHEGMVVEELTRARVVIVPALWFLSRRRDTRIFQDMTAVEILEEVLGDALGGYSRSIESSLDGEYPTREYCVQYAETDLDFCHRLMEEEGIFYTFDHEGEQEVMTLYDVNASCPLLPTADGSGGVPFRTQDLQILNEPAQLIHRAHAHTTTSVVVRDWDWTKGGMMTLEAESRGEDAAGRDRESYEHGEGRSLTVGDYSGTAYGAQDGDAQALKRKEAFEVEGVTLHGISWVQTMAPGARFSVTDHPTIGVDGDYLVTRVIHTNLAGDQLLPGGSPGVRYQNVFEAIPVATPYRPPRRMPKPTIPSVQTAVVTGPSGEEIHVDEHGRIKVQFHWDRVGANDEHSSCWIRVEQAWAGPSWGFWWVPRIGMEVVVQFVDGDPDRPLVTGCVYDGTNATPYPLPDEKTKSTIKSNSSLGGGGFNEFRFEDAAGSEEIYTHAQKDYNEVVENDHNTLVHHDQTNTVDNNQTQEIHVDQIEMVHGNQEMTVDGDRTVVVHSNFDETVDGTETRHVVGDVTETFDANETRTVTGDVTEDISGSETRTISGSQTETIDASHSRTISGSSTETITGSLAQNADAGITTTTPASYNVVAVGGYNVTAPGGMTLTAQAGLTIVAPAGLTQVDNRDFWTGNEIISPGVAAISIIGIKIEETAIVTGVTSAKVEATGFACATDNLMLDTEGFQSNVSVAKLRDALEVSGYAWRNSG